MKWCLGASLISLSVSDKEGQSAAEIQGSKLPWEQLFVPGPFPDRFQVCAHANSTGEAAAEQGR